MSNNETGTIPARPALRQEQIEWRLTSTIEDLRRWQARIPEDKPHVKENVEIAIGALLAAQREIAR